MLRIVAVNEHGSHRVEFNAPPARAGQECSDCIGILIVTDHDQWVSHSLDGPGPAWISLLQPVLDADVLAEGLQAGDFQARVHEELAPWTVVIKINAGLPDVEDQGPIRHSRLSREPRGIMGIPVGPLCPPEMTELTGHRVKAIGRDDGQPDQKQGDEPQRGHFCPSGPPHDGRLAHGVRPAAQVPRQDNSRGQAEEVHVAVSHQSKLSEGDDQQDEERPDPRGNRGQDDHRSAGRHDQSDAPVSRLC